MKDFKAKLPAYYKSVAAGVGGLVIFANELAHIAPGPFSAAILGGLTWLSVTLVENKKVVDAVSEA